MAQALQRLNSTKLSAKPKSQNKEPPVSDDKPEHSKHTARGQYGGIAPCTVDAWLTEEGKGHRAKNSVSHMPEENIDEITGHGHDIVLHELHVEQYLIDVHLIEFSLGHNERGHGIAEKKKRAGRDKKAYGEWTGASHKLLQLPVETWENRYRWAG